jgi:hypothetical protein
MVYGWKGMKSLMKINWGPIIATTLVLYSLTIFFLPFNSLASTILLLALISYWSRIPGCNIHTPFFILYTVDLVDLFSILVAINVNPISGAIFSLFGNIWPRVSGVTPPWQGVIKDAVSQVIVCLFMPIIVLLCKNNLVYIVIMYTVIRRILFIFAWIIYPYPSLIEFIFIWSGFTLSIMIINIFYAKYFGFFFDNIIKSGVSFNWWLFLGATIIIYISKLKFYGKSKNELNLKKRLKIINFLNRKDELNLHPYLKKNISDEELILEIKSII